MKVYCVFRFALHESNDLCYIASTQRLAVDWVKENGIDISDHVNYNVFEWTIDSDNNETT